MASPMHSGEAWTYAPRPGSRPDRSSTTEPSGRRTKRTSVPLPASSRQATQVLIGGRFTGCRTFPVARLDVDPKARQLGGEARVLAVAPDGQRQLAARHEHRGGTVDAVD